MLVGNANNENGFYQLLARSRNETSRPDTSPVSTFNANTIGCGPGPAATARRGAGVPAWRYVYAGEFPNQDIGIPGAWHGSEIGLVFGTTEYLSRLLDTPEEEKLSERMRTAWTTFAKDPFNGLSKLGWPLYNANCKSPVFLLTP